MGFPHIKRSSGGHRGPAVITDNHPYAMEFDALRPDWSESHTPQSGMTASDLSYIPSAQATPPNSFAHKRFFDSMVQHGWRKAQHHAGARQGGGWIGAQRGATASPQRAGAERPLFGHATGWAELASLERICAYTFRGDDRDPAALKAAGGFHPPSTRTDDAYRRVIAARFSRYMETRFGRTVASADIQRYMQGQGKRGRDFVEYEIWRMIMQGEELHIGKMIVNEFLKGYISTTRNLMVAKSFGRSGWMYVVHTDGGFLIPQQGKHAWARAAEFEVAHPGALPWAKIFGFRRLGSPHGAVGMPSTQVGMSGPVFMRQGFRQADPNAFGQAFALLSGKTQR